MLMVGQVGVTCRLALIGAVFVFMPQSTFRSYLVLALMMLFLFFMQAFVAVIFWLMLSEIFPLRIRGKAMGLAVFANWTANFIVAMVFPPPAGEFGWRPVLHLRAHQCGHDLLLSEVHPRDEVGVPWRSWKGNSNNTGRRVQG